MDKKISTKKWSKKKTKKTWSEKRGSKNNTKMIDKWSKN